MIVSEIELHIKASRLLKMYNELFFPVKFFIDDVVLTIKSKKQMNIAGKMFILPLQLIFKIIVLFFVVFITILAIPFWIPYCYVFKKKYYFEIGKKMLLIYRKVFFIPSKR